MSGRTAGAIPYLADVAHLRRGPLRHGFHYRTCSWLVDLDRIDARGRAEGLPPLLRRLARFRASDHLGRPERSWRANVEAWAAARGIELRSAHIQALTGARTFGHGFHPLTLYWCTRPSGAHVCTIAEVRNTYGERHVYLLPVDDAHHATIAKAFYVSPFNGVEGSYDVVAPPPGERLDVSMTLNAPGQPPFTATWRGRRATSRDRLTVHLRTALSTQLIAAQIRRQGLALWLRRLPLVPRPPHHEETV